MTRQSDIGVVRTNHECQYNKHTLVTSSGLTCICEFIFITFDIIYFTKQ